MIVIPMAGLSSRFTAQGYAQPKHMLDLHGHAVFDYAVARFASAYQTEAFLFIARQGAGVKDFIASRLAALGVGRFEIVLLAGPTRGQAETVAMGLDAAQVRADEPLCIFNIDTFAACGYRSFAADFPEAAGVLEVVRDQGTNWSFVEPRAPASSRVRRTTEKVPISDLCCTGLYWFRRQDQFLRALARERLAPQSAELYVAPLYNHLIAEGLVVEYDLVDRKDIILCGVPSEYESLTQLDGASGSRLFAIRAGLAGVVSSQATRQP